MPALPLLSLLFAATVAFALAPVQPSSAASITVTFSGTIDVVDDPNSVLDPSVVVGAAFAGSYTIDPDTFAPTEACSFDPNSPDSFCQYSGSLIGSVAVGSSVFDLPNEVTIRNNAMEFGGGGRVWDSWSIQDIPDPGEIGAFVSFLDYTHTKTDDARVFFVATSLVGWTEAHFVLIEAPHPNPNQSGGPVAMGAIQSVVPEPSTTVLLALGLAGLAGMVRSMRSASRSTEDER